jgi:hypothetical protein
MNTAVMSSKWQPSCPHLHPPRTLYVVLPSVSVTNQEVKVRVHVDETKATAAEETRGMKEGMQREGC